MRGVKNDSEKNKSNFLVDDWTSMAVSIFAIAGGWLKAYGLY